ncbi:MAG TPA: hypothetical protein PLQ54_13895 [Armatimonadota bacterium]|nr:hypothetical protein [Armatimonadota bacterium]
MSLVYSIDSVRRRLRGEHRVLSQTGSGAPSGDFDQALRAHLARVDRVLADLERPRREDESGTSALRAGLEAGIQEAAQWTQERCRAFHQTLRPFVEATGADLHSEIVLTLDGMGRVRVASPHPEASAIEELFANQPPLRYEFISLAAGSEFVRVAEEYLTFLSLGGRSRAEASERYARRSAGSTPLKFHMGLRGQSYRTFFAATHVPYPLGTV